MISLRSLLKENMWDKNEALDFLDLIGQTSVRFIVLNRGRSNGDFGIVDFRFSGDKLILSFSDRDEAYSAIIKISRALSNPYSFEKSRNKDNEVIVTLTE